VGTPRDPTWMPGVLAKRVKQTLNVGTPWESTLLA
jgi:hypothetical protein